MLMEKGMKTLPRTLYQNKVLTLKVCQTENFKDECIILLVSTENKERNEIM